MEEILTYTFWGNSLKEYLISLVAFVITIFVLKLFKNIGVVRLKKLANRTQLEINDLIMRCLELLEWPIYLVLALLVAFQFIQLPESLERYFSYFALIVVVYYLVKIILELINFGTLKIIKQGEEAGKKIDAQIIKLLNNILKVLVWLIAILVVLQNLGLDVTSLIAGLGIAGLAIALAVQTILGDILSCFSIYFDKPFEVDDFITLGDVMGTVKKIGIKSTRIQSLWGEEIVVSNRELTEIKIKNYKKMEKRRVQFYLGVKYETSTEKLKRIPSIVKETIEKIELCQFDRVHFYKFGDFSLVFDVVYYVLTPDYNRYMDIQQEINFAIKERFEVEKIDFAYPTQTIFVDKVK